MVKWDRGVDYFAMYRLLESNLKKERTKRGRCYSYILLIQLRNGLRVSEAVRAFKTFLLTNKQELEIQVSKKKKEERRLVVIPVVENYDYRECLDFLSIDEKILTERVRHYCRNKFKVNTHSLRYAFVTHLLKMNINPSIISKITKHSKLDYILTYTQEKESERVLRDPSIF